MAVTTKGTTSPFSPRGLRNAISSILGIQKRFVFIAFKNISGHYFFVLFAFHYYYDYQLSKARQSLVTTF